GLYDLVVSSSRGHRPRLQLPRPAHRGLVLSQKSCKTTAVKVLCVIEPGRAPSTRLRLGDCVERYRQAGIEITTTSARRSSLRERIRLVRQARHHDLVILFKTTGFSAIDLRLLRR